MRTLQETTMHTRTQLVTTGGRRGVAGARRPWACATYRRPDVRELPLRLEPVGPETFGGLLNTCSAPPVEAVLKTTTGPRGPRS